MNTIKINLVEKNRSYPIYVGRESLAEITHLFDWKKYSSIFILTDSHVAPLYLESLTEILSTVNIPIHSHIFQAGEVNKNLHTLEKIYSCLAEAKVDRKGILINLGGGVTTDMGGFAASTYLRGVSFINIPTTLEAMVDASVGGKTGVDLGNLKNYIGLFTHPIGVLMDVKTLKTLPERAFTQGYAEVIKHGLISNAKYFHLVTEKKPAQYSEKELTEIIFESVQIKAGVVETDATETSGYRKILNFGHTIGHAVESISLKTGKPLFHGEAVAIGMIAEAKISELSGMISGNDFKLIEQKIADAGLPTRYSTNDIVEIEKLILTDKKNEKGKVKWTLLEGIGQAVYNVQISKSFVMKAISYITE